MTEQAKSSGSSQSSTPPRQGVKVDVALINNAGAQVGKQILTFTTKFAAGVEAAMVKAAQE